MYDIFNNISNFIRGFFHWENYTLKNFTLCLLVMMCIQYMPIEGNGISNVKVGLMSIACIVFITNLKMSKALFMVFILYGYLFYSAYFINGDSFRSSRILYSLLFMITYIVFYNGVYVERYFTLDFFINFIRYFIYTFAVVFVLQQICIILGFKSFPLINLTLVLSRSHDLSRGIGSYSLSLEPSHFARILGVLFYAYLKCNEYKQGRPITIQQVFNPEHRLVTLSYLWAMLTMASGTAFICLGVISLYFMRGAYFAFTIPIFFVVYNALSYFEVKDFERATNVAEATVTGDIDNVREADGSAAVRITPLLYTLQNLDVDKKETWVGHGIDYSINLLNTKRIKGLMMVDDFGIIGWGLGMAFMYTCAIEFFSLANIMMWLGIGGGIGNVAYNWGILMIFTCIRFFHEEKKKESETDEEP